MDHAKLTSADLAVLVETGRELAAEVDLPRLLQTILGKACTLTGSLKGSVILHNSRRGTLYFAGAIGDKSSDLLEKWGEFAAQQIPIEGSKAGAVFASGTPIVDKTIQGDPAHFTGVDKGMKSSTESMVCVPLTCAGKRLGVMQILNKVGGDYTGRDLALLEHFADQAAIAIRNARLFESLVAHMGLFASREGAADVHALVEELDRPARLEKLTLVFADMRSFTQLCQVVNSAADLQSMLNDFLSMLAAEVIVQRGIVNKFLGDGLFAFFRGEDQERRAVLSAFGMVARFEELKRRWRSDTNVRLDFVDIGIGIVTDKVILGTTGMEGGLRDFTAIGTPVNLAAFFEQQARNGRRILTDGMTYRAVQDMVEAHGPVEIELRKPGQTVGHPYEHYHLTGLKSALVADASPAVVDRPRAAESRGDDVFISYSHKDAKWLQRIQRHLKPSMVTVTVWDDTRLEAGAQWREELVNALAAARVAVLLVTPDYLASDFIRTHELEPVLARASRQGVTILWVAVSASAYEETAIRDYQAANSPTEPLDSLSRARQNQVLVNICKKIKIAVSG